MADSTTLTLFMASVVALLLIPGPVMLYIVARSVEQGTQAGLVSVLAVGIGDMLHVIAAALGLSALVLSSAHAFAVVRYAGAAYLIWLGVQALRTRGGGGVAIEPLPLRRVFGQGVAVSALNPKTALFFLAFLPQFVRPEAGSVGAQSLVLGAIFVAMAIVSNSLFALATGAAAQWLRTSRALAWAQRYVAGTIYIALGLAAAAGSGSDG